MGGTPLEIEMPVSGIVGQFSGTLRQGIGGGVLRGMDAFHGNKSENGHFCVFLGAWRATRDRYLGAWEATRISKNRSKWRFSAVLGRVERGK
jgi:hypothetical protein